MSVALAEVLQAEESARVLDLQGRALVCFTGDEAADVVEWHAERSAIEAEAGARVGGLVSVPTSGKSATGHRTRERSKALRAALRATESDQHRARIARMRRQVGFTARCMQAQRPGFRAEYCAMVTLTYRDGAAWRGRHVSDFLQLVRKHMKARGVCCRYVWVAELQKRGAIHYHVALWLPVGFTLPKPDQCGWWDHGVTRIEAAKDSVAYLMKYLSKGAEPGSYSLPEGARMHGSGGVEHALRRARRWLGYPAWIKARADCVDDWRRAPGGGWSDPDGLVIPSEHVRAWVGDRWCTVQVADYGRPFPADGPFTWLAHRPA